MDSILDSTKKVLGLDSSYTAFDVDIIMHINATLGKLNQLGIGPPQGFAIESKIQTWADLLGDNVLLYHDVRTFVYLSVRLLFDPPPTSYGIAAFERQVEEFGWRISTRVEEANHPWTPSTT